MSSNNNGTYKKFDKINRFQIGKKGGIMKKKTVITMKQLFLCRKYNGYKLSTYGYGVNGRLP